jgi:Rod binding domain-containing protein
LAIRVVIITWRSLDLKVFRFRDTDSETTGEEVMIMGIANSISPGAASAATLSPQLASPAATLGRGAKAAREFEAHLIGSMLESMEKTFATLPGEDAMPGADNYNYLGTQALSEALAAKGGFGIAAMIARHLPAHEGTG